MPAPSRRPPRPLRERFLLGFGVIALSIAGVMLAEPFAGASPTVDACGYVGCVPTPTMAPPTPTTPPPPPPPPATPTATHAPPTYTPTAQPCTCPTATTAPPPPPPPATATPTEQPCTCPTATTVPPTYTATAPPPPPPPATATPTNQPCTCPTATPVPPTATPTTAPPPPPPPATPTATMVPVKEGCTPGFWKQDQHFGAWAIPQSTTLESVFDVPNSLNLDNETFLEALQGGGGSGINGAATILFRAATAAYLNSLNPEIGYPLTSAQIISQVNTALATNNRDAYLKLAGTLDADNNLGCPDAKSLNI